MKVGDLLAFFPRVKLESQNSGLPEITALYNGAVVATVVSALFQGYTYSLISKPQERADILAQLSSLESANKLLRSQNSKIDAFLKARFSREVRHTAFLTNDSRLRRKLLTRNQYIKLQAVYVENAEDDGAIVDFDQNSLLRKYLEVTKNEISSENDYLRYRFQAITRSTAQAKKRELLENVYYASNLKASALRDIALPFDRYRLEAHDRLSSLKNRLENVNRRDRLLFRSEIGLLLLITLLVIVGGPKIRVLKRSRIQ